MRPRWLRDRRNEPKVFLSSGFGEVALCRRCTDSARRLDGDGARGGSDSVTTGGGMGAAGGDCAVGGDGAVGGASTGAGAGAAAAA